MMASSGAATQPLAPGESATLQQMRDEERFARDVYAALGASTSELAQTRTVEEHHFMMMGMLLERYAVSDPAAGKSTGAFVDPAVQTRFAELVDRGKAGRAAALAVATEVEDQNLAHLTAALAGTTHDDLRHVYTRLSTMTRGHLRQFYTALVAEGGSYTPKYLERTMFEQVLTAADEPDGMGCTGCMGEGMGMGRRHGGGMQRGPGMQHGPGAMCPHR